MLAKHQHAKSNESTVGALPLCDVSELYRRYACSNMGIIIDTG